MNWSQNTSIREGLFSYILVIRKYLLLAGWKTVTEVLPEVTLFHIRTDPKWTITCLSCKLTYQWICQVCHWHLLTHRLQPIHAETKELFLGERYFWVKICFKSKPQGTYSYQTTSRSVRFPSRWLARRLARKTFFWPISGTEFENS